jgi:hypothetical protein
MRLGYAEEPLFDYFGIRLTGMVVSNADEECDDTSNDPETQQEFCMPFIYYDIERQN